MRFNTRKSSSTSTSATFKLFSFFPSYSSPFNVFQTIFLLFFFFHSPPSLFFFKILIIAFYTFVVTFQQQQLKIIIFFNHHHHHQIFKFSFYFLPFFLFSPPLAFPHKHTTHPEYFVGF